MRLTVVIPAYNEEKRLPETLGRLKSALPPGTEIIVSDDGSTDGTLSVARGFGCKVCVSLKNTGKSGAVVRGAQASGAGAVLICDADLPVPEEDILNMIDIYKKGGFDLVIASRYKKGARIKRTPARALAGKIFSLYVRALFKMPFSDTQCGVKLLNKETAGDIILGVTEKGYLFDIELLSKAHEAGLKITEVPVAWADKPGSKISLLRDSLKMAAGALSLRRRLRQTGFGLREEVSQSLRIARGFSDWR